MRTFYGPCVAYGSLTGGAGDIVWTTLMLWNHHDSTRDLDTVMSKYGWRWNKIHENWGLP